MNSEVFENWFREKLLNAAVVARKNALRRAVIVIDRASYHVRLTPKSAAATMSMSKVAMSDWIVEHRCRDEEGMLYTKKWLQEDEHVGPSGRKARGLSKSELYEIASVNQPKKDLQVWEWTRKFNEEHMTDVRVLVLPVAHPELNPIELQWSDIKRYVRKNNFDCNMRLVRELAEQRQKMQTKESWKAVQKRSHEFALMQWKSDEVVAKAREKDVAEHIEESDVEEESDSDEIEGSGSDS